MCLRVGGVVVDGISELAKLLKERENVLYLGPIVGTILSPPPEIKVQIDKNIVLNKNHLIIAGSLLKGYKRLVMLESTKEQDYIMTTDTLKVNDEVILIPSMDENTYFLTDWAVRL